MKEIALEFINLITDYGYEAYIVGGFVRDLVLNIASVDIDITTNATPKEIGKIFSNLKLKKNMKEENTYGSVRVYYKNVIFEVTTFREEFEYLDNRHPSSIRYVEDLETDLKRRDFTMNAICMDKNGDIIDPLNGLRDTKNHIIKTIGNSKKSFRDDALRILRAIRFMITLDFQLDKEIIEAIQETKKYLKNISYERKKVELDKIFASPKAKEGIEVLKQLDLIEALDLENIDRIQDYTDLIGIWSMINSKYYRFTKHERELITKVNQVYHFNNEDPKILYRYGLYVNTLAGVNKGMDKKKIAYKYSHLPIKAKSDIDITAFEICELLNKKPGPFLNSIYQSLEDMILSGQLKNKKNDIIMYIKMNVVK